MINCAKKDQDYYSVHCVSMQVEFVKVQPSNVKDLIRLVKYWRKTCIESTGNARLPSSYPLELITIACWEKAGKPSKFDTRAGFKAVLQQLVDNSRLHVIWDTYYSDAVANKGIKRMKKMNKRFVFVLVKGKSQARPRWGGDAHIKAMGVIIVPFRGGSNL